MDHQKSQDIEIRVPVEDDLYPPEIKWWGYSKEGSCEIRFVDPMNDSKVSLPCSELLSYIKQKERTGPEWERLVRETRAFISRVAEEKRLKDAENNKPITKNIKRYEHYYDPVSPKKGALVSDHVLKVDPNTEEIVEDIAGKPRYEITIDSLVKGQYWVHEDVLDDLLDKGIEEIRIFIKGRADVKSFTPMEFIDHGKVERKKVYISLKDIKSR